MRRRPDWSSISSARNAGCGSSRRRYIWQRPEALAARYMLCDNLRRAGYDPEEMVLGRIERDMDKYFSAFNLVNLNDLL